MTVKCPIKWNKEDGPFPCAFLTFGNCSHIDEWHGCIPKYIEKYNHAIKFVVTLCPRCQVEVDNTYGQVEHGIYPLCYSCSEKVREMEVLSDHIRGD